MPAPVARLARGAIMAETAIVTYFVLGLVLGALQLGLLGFLQITGDAGAFLNAHYNALGASGCDTSFTSTEAATATNAVLPQVPTTQLNAPVVLRPAIKASLEGATDTTSAACASTTYTTPTAPS